MIRTVNRAARGLALVLVLGACQDAAEDAAMEGEAPPEAPMPAESAAPADGAMLDPNTATQDQLLAVPNLDATLADALVAARPFADMRGVDAVLANTLSEEQRDSVYTRLWLPLDLNTATAEEILLIPGVGPRMQHEFEEYRPYSDMAQFRREIGKYVDDEEVARLERYVTIR